MIRQMRLGAFMVGLTGGLFLVGTPGQAMTLKACSTLYQAAKANGTLNGQDWRSFRASQCPAEASDAGAVDAQVPATTTAEPAAAIKAAPVSDAAAGAAGLPDFPSAIDPRYASEKPARARLHTCSNAYHAAKKAGTLHGLRWIQKGGGFYSLCNRALKKQA